MPCYKPLVAYRNAASGTITFHKETRYGDTGQILLPCGRCIGCRLQRANDWATRCLHEKSLHTENAFITLTYEKLTSPSLQHRDWQLFAKRLRKALTGKKHSTTIVISDSLYQYADMGLCPIPRLKTYMAGEYGEQGRRPHFHACLFGIDFTDKQTYSVNNYGDMVYRSATLRELWGHGNVTTGAVTYESAAYIARYIMAKVTGEKAEAHYTVIDPNTGELIQLKPEYNKMSLREGIGKGWLDKYQTDVYPHGYVITRGKKNKAPKYYDKIYKQKERNNYDEMKTQREYEAYKKLDDNTDDRLQSKQTVKQAQISQLKRKI